ncbi:hypothetical protein LZ32DRAFT_69387 [Colletotrichum eremochloae]|nr:hypothetical protein LZ32DRAFT_69387 [Colletotrichum eremochloae]
MYTKSIIITQLACARFYNLPGNHHSTTNYYHIRSTLLPMPPVTADCAMEPDIQPKVSDLTPWSPATCRKDASSSTSSSTALGLPAASLSDDVSHSPSTHLQNPVNPHPRPRLLRRKQGLALMNSNQIRNNSLKREAAVGGSSEYYHRPLPLLPVPRRTASTGESKIWRSTTEEQEVLEELADRFDVETK